MEIEKVRNILDVIHERRYYKILRMKEQFREKEMRERISKAKYNQSLQPTKTAGG